MHFTKLITFAALLVGSVVSAAPSPATSEHHEVENGLITIRDPPSIGAMNSLDLLPRDEFGLEKRGDLGRIQANLKRAARQAIQTYHVDPASMLMHSNIGVKKAFTYAKQHNGLIVENIMARAVFHQKNEFKDTLCKYCIPKENFVATDADRACGDKHLKEQKWVAAWKGISEAWAEHCQGHTILLTNKQGPASASFYKKVEEPILEKNHVAIHTEIVD